MKNKVWLEYIWLDGYVPVNYRSKIKVLDMEGVPTLDKLPDWNFDGSSTAQAVTGSSDCVLKPVRIYSFDPKRNHYIVLSEVYNVDGTPHESNSRRALADNDHFKGQGYWFGFEQEYFIIKDFMPVAFQKGLYPRPQGLYYCGVGSSQIVYRNLVEEHMELCLEMGMNIEGINAEVAPSQWEYQCFSKDGLKACDDLIVSRYVLFRMAEKYGLDIDLHPKPVKGDWNGSGCHCNFSNEFMREKGGKDYFDAVLSRFKEFHPRHILDYGEFNNERLTGHHETQSMQKFDHGVGSRNTSIRIQASVAKVWKGYMEDRRPASNCDPYKVALSIAESCHVH